MVFNQALKMTGKIAWLRIAASRQCRLGLCFVGGEVSLSMYMDHDVPLFFWDTQVVYSSSIQALFKQDFRAKFEYSTSDVTVQDSSGHPDAEICCLFCYLFP